MSWILTILKNLPALLAAIQAILAIFTGKAAMANHAAYKASIAAGRPLGDDVWNWYVLGEGAGAGAFAIGAIACLCMAPEAYRMANARRLEIERQARRERLERNADEREALTGSR